MVAAGRIMRFHRSAALETNKILSRFPSAIAILKMRQQEC